MWVRTGQAVLLYCRDERRGTREHGALDFGAPEAQIGARMDDIDPLPQEDCACVGLYRGETDFVEISPIGDGRYFLWAERARPRTGLFGWLGRTDRVERTLADRPAAMAALRVWCERSWEAFARGEAQA